MAREMPVNVTEGEECRIAVVEDGVLEELYVERTSLQSFVGNIYKGRVVNIESGIQAAFVDFGEDRNGFLHISDLHPRYFPAAIRKQTETVGKRKSLKERPPIQNCLRKGDELIVQVTKDGVRNKGPTLSTYLAMPGKYLVMMPWMKMHGVSHKIEDEQERTRLRQILEEAQPPKTVGFIIRTAGEGCSKRDIHTDLKYLLRLWDIVQKRIDKESVPADIYQESDLVIRTLRDIFNSRMERIICDSERTVRKIKDFLYVAMPRLMRGVAYHEENVPLFHKYHIEEEIAKIQSRTVALKAGGSIVIEPTEALVSIDVNSGRYHGQQNAEQTAYKINMEAAAEIARQLRLRDLGGLIICDFIDMRNPKNRREVEKAFRNACKSDRAHSKILKISNFGVIEMTRQRMRPSLRSSTYLECPNCHGSGFIKSNESLAIEIIRLLNLASSNPQIKRIELFVSPEVADFIQNEKRIVLAEIENRGGNRIVIRASLSYAGEKHELVCYNEQGNVVKL